MTQTLISHLTADHVGQTVSLKGRVQTIRSSGKVAFVELRDGSGYIQCVAEPNINKQSQPLNIPNTYYKGEYLTFDNLTDTPRPEKPTHHRDHVDCMVQHRSDPNKFLILKCKMNERFDCVGGGLDGDAPVQGGIREIIEETGYTDITPLYEIPLKIRSHFYRAKKEKNLQGYHVCVVYKLNSDAHQAIEAHEAAWHEILWVTLDEIYDQGHEFCKIMVSLYKHYNTLYTTPGLAQSQFDTFASLGQESSLSVTGIVSKHPKKDEYELQVRDFFVYQNTKDYPLGTKDDHGPDFLFDHRHLYLRSRTQRAIQRVRDTIIHATYDRMRHNGFTKIDSPIFTPNACEGTTELYAVKHVNDEIVYLSQSGQLYLEAAIASVGKCYDFGPVFRAEHCKTRRHLNEFWMMDAEIPFAQQEENMQAQEQLVWFILQEVLKKNRTDLVACGANIEALEKITFPFRRITHAQRCQELKDMGFEVPADGNIGSDLEMQYCQRQEQPVFITNFPIEQKAFYFKEDPAIPGTVLGADLLAPGDCGEIIGGGTRIDDYDTLLKAMKKHNLPIEEFQWYLDLRKYGSVPHAGFGYGLERLVRWICGVHHIRETIPFPRYNNRLKP